MTIGIRPKILLSFGILAVVLGCSSTAFSQTRCSTATIAKNSPFPSGVGISTEVMDITSTGDFVVNICKDAANPSPQAQPTSTTACPNPPAQPTVTPTETPEEVRQRRAEEQAEKLANKPERTSAADRAAERETGRKQ